MTDVWFCYSTTRNEAYWTLDEDAYNAVSSVQKYHTEKMVAVGARGNPKSWQTEYDGRVYTVTHKMPANARTGRKWNLFAHEYVEPEKTEGSGVTLEELLAEDEGE